MTIPVDPFSIATGYEILKIAKREGWLNAAIDFVRPKHRALLLGSTGAGKTQFLKSIAEIAPNPIPVAARTEFPTVARFAINSRLFEFVDTPGQLEHKPIRDESTKSEIKRGIKGVINFVSYGYHDYGLPLHDVITDGQVRPTYLAEHRQREIDLLSEWAPLLSAEWILTVITKADIWWDKKNEVASFYRNGPYRERISHLFPHAHCIVRPYSSLSSRFFNCIPGATTFDDTVRISLRSELFRLLREAVERQMGPNDGAR